MNPMLYEMLDRFMTKIIDGGENGYGKGALFRCADALERIADVLEKDYNRKTRPRPNTGPR